MRSRHHPSGNGVHHCDSEAIEIAIKDYQCTGSTAALSTFLSAARERALTLIRYNGVTRYRTESELMSDINFKLLRAVDKFDPTRGTGFTFLSAVVMNALRSSVTSSRKHLGRFVELDESVSEQLPANSGSYDGELLEDVVDMVRREARSALSDEDERATQRWYLQSFCAEGFEARRHVCANAAVRAFGLGPARAREVFDLSALECRRILFGSLKRHRPTIPGRLYGTRSFWMTRLRPLLSETEFVKLFWLLRDLSPGTIFLIDPANRSRRQDRNQPVTRESLLWILDGHPLATRLFPTA
jgi:hypothetical protein